MELDISKLSSEQFENLMAVSGNLVLPLGSLEITGRHAPLGTDIIVASHVVPLLCGKAGIPYAPLIPYGDTLEFPESAGTVLVSEDILKAFYYSVAGSFFKCSGLKRLFFINFHSLNNRAVDSTCRLLRSKGKRAYLIDWWKTVGQSAGDILDDKIYGRGHGAEMITSVLMAFAPEQVNLSLATNILPKKELDFYNQCAMNSGTSFIAYGNFRDYSTESTWGNLSGVSADKGRLLVAAAVEKILEFIQRTGLIEEDHN
jgi:creatinine amidohydrolase